MGQLNDQLLHSITQQGLPMCIDQTGSLLLSGVCS
jgi:hypothetical protein